MFELHRIRQLSYLPNLPCFRLMLLLCLDWLGVAILLPMFGHVRMYPNKKSKYDINMFLISFSCKKSRSLDTYIKHWQTIYLICYIVHNNRCLCTTIIHWCKTVITLLPRSIPDFKFYSCVVQTNRLC